MATLRPLYSKAKAAQPSNRSLSSLETGRTIGTERLMVPPKSEQKKRKLLKGLKDSHKAVYSTLNWNLDWVKRGNLIVMQYSYRHVG